MTLAELVRAGRASGPEAFSAPYIIAEAGVNHEGSLDTARRIISEAAEAGAQAVKFQTYRAGTLASKNSPAYWDTSKEPTKSQYELFLRHDSFWKTEFEQLKLHCDKEKVEFLSTPFDRESAAFLNDLMEVVKISSSDITNKPFIRHLCAFGKPVLLSTGASEAWEVMEAASWLDVPFALLHCVLNYPTEEANAGLSAVTALRSLFPDRIIGYSDHTLPDDMEACTAAALLGARIIEKHFTHDKSLPGNDHYHAMNKADLALFRRRLERLERLCGKAEITSLVSEAPARANARRSLVAARRIPAGQTFGPDDLTAKRPAHGISPRHSDEVAGMRARSDILEDTVLHWSMLE